MKSFDELSDRFESIPELPISEELLGSYIDGNLESEDALQVENFIGLNPMVSDIYSEVVLKDKMDFSDMLNNEFYEDPMDMFETASFTDHENLVSFSEADSNENSFISDECLTTDVGLTDVSFLDDSKDDLSFENGDEML